MKKLVLPFVILFNLSVMLSGCFGPSTPGEVSQAFWKAVLADDKSDVVEYSTLTDKKYYDGFSKDWADYQLSLGKMVIDQQQASIDTRLDSPTNSGKENRRFITYLVLQDDKWKVDYERTGQAIKGGVLGELFSTLNKVGNEISRQIQSSADAFSQDMARMTQELEQLSREFEQQATQSVEKYAEQMRKSIEALKDSIDRALEDENNQLSDEDRDVLKVIADDLEKDTDKLSSPSIQAVADGNKSLSERYNQIEKINNAAFDKYKKEWQALSEEYRASMQKMMDDLSVEKNRQKD